MSASNSTPDGVRSLLECLSRATLLAQPDDIPHFLSTHVDKITHFREEDSGDIKKAIIHYQEQWENDVLQKQSKKKDALKTAQEESCSLACSISTSLPLSFKASPPCEVRHETRTVASTRIASRQERAGQVAKKISPPNKQKTVPLLPHGKRPKACQIPSLRIPCRNGTKPSLPSSLPPLQPVPQKGAKQGQRQKSTKWHVSSEHTCRLIDCPYHSRGEERSALDRGSGPVRAGAGPIVKSDAGTEKPPTTPGTFEIQVPYRPKGGPVIDPELEPRRTRAGPLSNKTTSVGGTLPRGRCGVAYAVSESANCSDLSQVSLESFPCACPRVAHSVHIVRYRCMHVKSSSLQPQ